MKKWRLTALLANLVGTAICYATELSDSTLSTGFEGSYEVEAAASVSSGGHTPFWLITNRSGLGSVKTNTGFVRAAAHAGGRIDRHWSLRGGVDLVGSWRSESPFLIRELYGAIRYRAFELSAGSRLENDRLVDMHLSSGDLLFSGNAVPIPQIKLSMPGYMDIPGLNGWLGFKAFFSIGWLTDSRWQRNYVGENKRYFSDVMYHSKGLRLRIGNPSIHPLTFEGGLEMAAQYGGKVMIDGEVIKKMPASLKDFFHVVIPSGGGGSDFPGEEVNVLGNHGGEGSGRLNWRLRQDLGLSAYYLHFFDDHSMMFFDYVWHDGLFGLELTLPSNPVVGKVVYEYLYMKDQSGPFLWDHTSDLPEQVSGDDDYYNNHLYAGWEHWGMGIGNPLIISPVWNGDNSLKFKCNRVVSHHVGLAGHPLSWLDWRLLASYTRGWGRYKVPYPFVKDNVNLLAEVTCSPARLKGWSATAAVGLDFGNMLGKSRGVMLSIKKTGIL